VQSNVHKVYATSSAGSGDAIPIVAMFVQATRPVSTQHHCNVDKRLLMYAVYSRLGYIVHVCGLRTVVVLQM
jgi:hypothetical protein